MVDERHSEVADLIDRSSLGTPEARRLRSLTDATIADEVREDPAADLANWLEGAPPASPDAGEAVGLMAWEALLAMQMVRGFDRQVLDLVVRGNSSVRIAMRLGASVADVDGALRRARFVLDEASKVRDQRFGS